MAARKRTVKLGSEWRERIRVAKILERVEKHALGEVEMKTSELKAAEILLRKSLPDLASVEHTGELAVKHLTEMDRDELLRIAARGREGTVVEGRCEELPSDVH